MWRGALSLFFAVIFAALPARAGASDTLTVAVQALPRGLGHPYVASNAPAMYTFMALYDGLTFVGNDGQAQPWLATAWKQTSDLTWEFTLRPGVTFSNGEAFTSDAVVEAVKYITSADAVSDVITGELVSLAGISGARAIDDLTVEISTRMPNPLIPRYVTALRVIAPNAWRTLGPQGYAKAPVGTGPFKVEEWGPAKVTFTAFKESWRPPQIERLEILVLPDVSARVQGLLSGRVDIATAMVADDMDQIEMAGHRVQANPGTGVVTMVLDQERDERFRDIRVREALNIGINRERITQVLLHGLVKPATQFTQSSASGFDPALKAYPYDPDRARSLLKDAGYADGFAFTVEAVVGLSVSNAAIFQQIAADLAEVGVQLTVRPAMLNQISQNMNTGQGWVGTSFVTDYGTAPAFDSLRAMRLHSCLHRFPWYCDKEGLPILQQAVSAKTEAEKIELTRQVFRRYHDQYAAILLWDVAFFDAIRSEVGEVPAVASWFLYDRITKSN